MPPKRAKAAAAKHDLPDKSQAIDGPAKKKQKAGGGGAKNVITIDDDEGGPTPDKPEPKQQAKQKNDKEIRIKPESTQVTRLKQIIKPGKSFPRFHDGDVVIVLIHGSTKYSYQLHGSILERASPWFRNMLRLKMQQIEADPEFVANHPIASRLLARFDLDYASELKIPELRRTVLTYLDEVQILPAPKKSSHSALARNGNHLKAETRPNASKSTPQSENSTGEVTVRHCPELQSHRAEPKIPDLKVPSTEKAFSQVNASISAHPEIIEVDHAIDQSQPEEDVIMTGVNVQMLAEILARKASQQSPGDPASVKTDRSSSAGLVPVTEGKSPFEQEHVDDDSIMQSVSTMHMAESVEGAPRSRTPTQNLSPASSSFDAMTRRSPIKGGEYEATGASQSPRAAFAIVRREAAPPDPNVTVKKELETKQEKADHEIMEANVAENTTNNTTEGIDANERTGTTKAPVVATGSPYNVPALVSEASSSNKEECSEVIFTGGAESISVKQEADTGSVPPQALDEEIATKEEVPDALLSYSGVEMDHIIKQEADISSSASGAVEGRDGAEEKTPHALSACTGLPAPPAVEQEHPEAFNCVYTAKQEAGSEQSDCELPPDAGLKQSKRPEGTTTAGQAECSGEKPSFQDDGTTAMLSGIPQGDGTSEENALQDRTAVQPSKMRITRQQSNSYHAPSGSTVVEKSNESRNKSVLRNAGEHNNGKTSSPVTSSTQEPRPTRGDATPQVSIEQTSDRPLAPAVQITEEKSKAAPVTMTSKPSHDILGAYHDLFLIYYNQPPLIDNKDITVALKQSEHLIDVARLYGSIKIVRPHINSVLLNFGRELYQAITKDPPRWLQLAFYLEAAAIFRECIIHIVVNHPYWPWPTQELCGPFMPIVQLIEKKLRSFETLKESINVSLFSNEIRQIEPFSRAPNKEDFDTWFVVQYWRDWFTGSLAKANKASEIGEKCVRGRVYRDLHRGGEAYLPTILVLDAVEACRSKDLHTKAKRQGVERDLKALKDFAKKAVEPLCANYSMLSVEDVGVDHLTCIKVEDHELPWLNSEGNLM